MGESEFPLARADRVRGRRGPAVGAWLAICLGAALLLPGASDGPGAAGPDGPSGAAAGPKGGPARADAPGGGTTSPMAAVERRIALPVDRVVSAGANILGRGEAPDVWSTPLRLEIADEADAGERRDVGAAKRATPEAPAPDLRFSLVNLTDLAPLRPAADLPAADPPAADLPAADTPAANAPASAGPADVPAEPGTATPRPPSVARRAAAAAAPRPVAPRILGKWAPEAEACQRRKSTYLPVLIGPKGAKAGGASCRFGTLRASGSGWAVAASCASGRERWTSNVTLTVVGNRLTWSSERGTQTYQRCG